MFKEVFQEVKEPWELHCKESPLAKTLNSCQAQPAPHFIALSLSASADSALGEHSKEMENIPTGETDQT